MSVREFMADNAATIIDSIQKKDFSSRDFIFKAMKDYEHDYIRLLNEDDTEHPIWNVNKQIGGYLEKHAAELGIIKRNERESSPSPFGGDSSTESWEKTK